MASFHTHPAINLRMKWTSPETTKHVPKDLLTDQIDLMIELDRSYQCGDYLLYQTTDEHAIDSLARKKMIDWMIRVVDHYCNSREVVASAANILDRFVCQLPCDRITFKLAAITSLYLASKVHDHTNLPLANLISLCRKEVNEMDIVDMESKILRTLGWRVNPVTVHSFIHSLVQLVPVANADVVAAIYDRAIFFAELCLFDYSYVTRSRSIIAVASVLNSLEGLGEGLTSEDSEQAFMEILQVNTCLDLSCHDLDFLREDLWYVYSMSAQYQEDDMQLFPGEMISECEKQHHVLSNDIAYSPVSVLSRKRS